MSPRLPLHGLTARCEDFTLSADQRREFLAVELEDGWRADETSGEPEDAHHWAVCLGVDACGEVLPLARAHFRVIGSQQRFNVHARTVAIPEGRLVRRSLSRSLGGGANSSR